MTFLRSCSLALWLTAVGAAAAANTPVRDLTVDPIKESHCDWPGFEQDDDLDGVMVLLQGNKLAEWRNPEGTRADWFGVNYQPGTTQHAQFSVTKTWVSVLVGMLYRDGFLNWETEHPDIITLGDIFSDEEVWDEMWDIPYIINGNSKVPELKAITLGELLAMRTGYSENGILSDPFDTDLVQDLDRLIAWWHPLYRKGVIESQTCFKCGDYLPTSGIVNYIIKEKTKTAMNPRGWDPLEYARQTSASLPNGNLGLFEALGMERGSYTWDRDGDGVAHAAFGLWADLEDMAKFGQLLLQGGVVLHNGVEKEVVPSYYLNAMTTTQSRMAGLNFPYGYQVWNWGDDDNGDSGFCAEGLGWQSICVFPKDEMVVAIQAPVAFGLETFASNIGFRNDAIKAIREGVVCSPTAAPTSSNFVTSQPTSAPVNDDNNGDGSNNGGNDNGNGGDGNGNGGNGNGGDGNGGDGNGNGGDGNTDNDGGDGNDDENNADGGETNLLVGKEEEESNIPVGLVIALVLAFAIICVLLTLVCCARRRKEKEVQQTRAIDAMCKVLPDKTDDKNEKIFDVELDDLDSVDTENSDGVTYYVEAEDVEQRSTAV
eukprot:scaffold23480_cov106-Cylindrotheca_fusiformis.AAC.3